jgi:membrane-associated protein
MEHLLYLLTKYGYFILFPLAILEGPILTVVTGFLCSVGIFNPFIAFPVLVSGDTVGDSLYYSLGRSGNTGFVKKFGSLVGINDAAIAKALVFFDTNPGKTISLSKIILGVGVAGLFLAGHIKVPFKNFLLICICTSIVQCSMYLCVGMFFGKAYQQINTCLNYFAATGIIILFMILLFYGIKAKKKSA